MISHNFSVFDLIIWAFTLSIFGQLFAFLTTSINIGIIGVCIVGLLLLSTRSFIILISEIQTIKEFSYENTRQKVIIVEFLFPGLTSVLSVLLLASVEFFTSLGFFFFSFRSFLALSIVFFFLGQAFLLYFYQNIFVNYKLHQETLILNEENEKYSMFAEILPGLIFFSTSLIIMVFSIIIVNLIPFLEIDIVFSDFLEKIVLFFLLHIPLAIISLLISNRIN
jgi:hypothetical protein